MHVTHNNYLVRGGNGEGFWAHSFLSANVNLRFGSKSACNIVESVDSISRDGTDTPILYVIHYKTQH